MEDALTEIMEILYMHRSDCSQLTVRIGIWDDTSVPYTLYASLYDRNDNIMAGESSYGSDSLTEALAALLTEVQHMVKEVRP